ncbi:MAG: hypothetical protein ABL958_07150 [Bdellovibrionia bacterium]
MLRLLTVSLVFVGGLEMCHARAIISLSQTIEDQEFSDNPYPKITERVLLDSTIVNKIREAQKICTQSVFKKGKRVTQPVLCPSWKKRLAVIVRWIQNSKYYPFRPLEKMSAANAHFELVKADSPNDATYASPVTIDFLREFSAIAKEKFGLPLKLTALTTGPEQNSDFHQTHLTGFVFDVRPFPGDVPTTWRSPNKKIYDQKMNRDLILSMIGQSRVKKIIFNDPRILKDKLVKRALGDRWAKGYKPLYLLSDIDVCKEKKWKNCDLKAHDNHMHVELNMPSALERVAHILLEETNRRPIRTTGLKEDFGNRN